MLPAEAETERKAWILEQKPNVRAEGAGIPLRVWAVWNPTPTLLSQPLLPA